MQDAANEAMQGCWLWSRRALSLVHGRDVGSRLLLADDRNPVRVPARISRWNSLGALGGQAAMHAHAGASGRASVLLSDACRLCRPLVEGVVLLVGEAGARGARHAGPGGAAEMKTFRPD